jgi:hypothetical protein
VDAGVYRVLTGGLIFASCEARGPIDSPVAVTVGPKHPLFLGGVYEPLRAGRWIAGPALALREVSWSRSAQTRDSPGARPAATSARSSAWPTTRRPASSREQGGVSLRLASLRALLRQLSREESHAPSFARIGRLSGRRELVRHSDAAGVRACRAKRGSPPRRRHARRRSRAGLLRPLRRDGARAAAPRLNQS